MGPTVVTLGPLNEGAQELTFEEAFGEHSEFRGRGRSKRQDRRQKRRMKRIKNRNERKLTRQEAHLEKRRRRHALKDEDKDETPASDDAQSTSGDSASDSTPSAGYSNDVEQGSSSNDEPQRDDSSNDSQEDDSSQDSSNDSDSDTDESGFDGVLSEDEARSFSVEGGQPKLHPKVEELTRRIKWNRKLIEKLRSKMTKQNAPSIQKQIHERESRIVLLRDELTEVKKHLNKKTVVSKSLNSKISKNRIEVKSNATGTGLNGIDNATDFDAPDTRVVEITSGFDGSAQSINWKPILLGLGIGAIIIYAVKKGKVFGK